MALQIRRGTTAERLALGGANTPSAGELLYTTDSKKLFVGDGSTAGGLPAGYFGAVAVASQTTLYSTGSSETLTVAAGTGISLTTTPGTNTLTISASITPVFDLKGSLFADDSTMMVDGTNGQIVGPINSFDGTNSILMSPLNGVIIGGTGGAQIIGAAGAGVFIGAGTSGTTSGTVTIGHGGNAVIVNGTLTATLSGNVTGNVNGNVTGNITGNIKSTNTNATILNTANPVAEYTGNVTGNVNGNVTGNVNGDVIGNLYGPVYGSDSSILLDNTGNGNFYGTVKGTFNNDRIQILDNEIRSLTSNDDIVINPSGTGKVDIFATVGVGRIEIFNDVANAGLSLANITPTNATVIISNTFNSASTSNDFVTSPPGQFSGAQTGSTVTFLRARGTVFSPADVQANDELGTFDFNGFISSTIYTSAVRIKAVADGISGANVAGRLEVLAKDTAGANAVRLTVSSTAITGAVPFKLPVVADDTARTALVSSPAKGMLIFMESGTTPAATNQAQVFDGTNWVNL